MDPRRRRGDRLWDYVFDVLVIVLASQSPGPLWGLWYGCRQEEESDETCGFTIISRKPYFTGVHMCLSSCILQLLFLVVIPLLYVTLLYYYTYPLEQDHRKGTC